MQLHSFLTIDQGKESGQLHDPADLPLGNEPPPRDPMNSRAEGAPKPMCKFFGKIRKNLLLSQRIESRFHCHPTRA